MPWQPQHKPLYSLDGANQFLLNILIHEWKIKSGITFEVLVSFDSLYWASSCPLFLSLQTRIQQYGSSLLHVSNAEKIAMLDSLKMMRYTFMPYCKLEYHATKTGTCFSSSLLWSEKSKFFWFIVLFLGEKETTIACVRSNLSSVLLRSL